MRARRERNEECEDEEIDPETITLSNFDIFQVATDEVYKIISPPNLNSVGVKTFSDDGDGPYEDTTSWVDLHCPLRDLIEERFDVLNEMIGGFPEDTSIEVSIDESQDDTVLVKVDGFELLRFIINN